MPQPAVVGLLYPGFGAEDDFTALEARLDGAIRLPLVHTSVGEDAHRVDALLDLGSTLRLAAGARVLTAQRPHSVVWACTSGSFVFGWEGARKQVEEVGTLLGLPVSSTSIGFVNATHAMRISRVAIAASYPADVASAFVEFLADGAIDAVAVSSRGIVTAAEVGRLDRDAVLAMVRDADIGNAEALLVPDTAMHSLGWLNALEAAVGKPVLTANQVTVWEGLRLLGPVPRFDSLGSLFELEPVGSEARPASTGAGVAP